MRFRIPYLKILAIPVLLTAMGIASNQIVLIVNHDKFPVMLNERVTEKMRDAQIAHECGPKPLVFNPFNVLDTGKTSEKVCRNKYGTTQFIDDTHSFMGSNSKMKALADIFDLGSAVYSVGDGLIALGSILLGYAPIVWLTLVIKKFND